MKLSIHIFASLSAIVTTFSQSAIATSVSHTLPRNSLNVNSQHALVNKASECTSMIRVINQTVAETNSATNLGTNGDIQTIEKLSRIFDKAAKDIDSIYLIDEKLKTYRVQFLSMYQGASANNKQLAINVKKRRSTKVSEGLRRSKNIFSPERDLTTGLNTYCRS